MLSAIVANYELIDWLIALWFQPFLSLLAILSVLIPKHLCKLYNK